LLPTGHGAAAGSQQPGQPTAIDTASDTWPGWGQPTATDTASDTWPGWEAWSSAGDATWQQAQAGGDGEAAAAQSVEQRRW
jgi:hypothetical protein